MIDVLHVLPHPGGGAETYLSRLGGLEGFSQTRVELARAPTPLVALPDIARRYPSLFRRMRAADLVHVHGDASSLLTLPLTRSRQFVWTTHGLNLLRRQKALASPLRLVIAGAARTICTSDSEAAELAAIAPALSDRLEVIYNCTPKPQIPSGRRDEVRHELGLGAGDVAVLLLGSLDRYKRPLDAVEAVRLANTRGCSLVLLIAGSGPLENVLRAYEGPSVRVLGFRNDPERLLAASDIFAMPSEREGMSYATLEAMAFGVATVVSNGPGAVDAVGESGIVVPVGDCERLAQALEELARSPERRAELGASARLRAETVFTCDRMRASTARIYRQALAP